MWESLQPLWTAEWIVVGFFASLLVLSRFRPLRAASRRRIVIVSTVCMALAVLLAQLRLSTSLQIVREWVAGVYLMQGYWLCGLFFTRPMRAVERRLLAFDTWLFSRRGIRWFVSQAPRLAVSYFELTYLLTYPFVPACFGLFLVLGGRAHTDAFWTAVLTAAFGCYGVLPWVQTRPPRGPVEHARPDARDFRVRRINVAVLRYVSVQVNTFPSGHASMSLAAALAVASVNVAIGAPLVAVALSIVVATVLGRYHYTVDSILDAASRSARGG